MTIENDAIVLAKALLEEIEYKDSHGNTVCTHCLLPLAYWNQGTQVFYEKPKHETWCPVLVAKDILTGY